MGEDKNRHQYYHLALAGTFDRLHQGHKALMELGFKLARKVSIGIAKKELCQNKLLAATIETFKIRKETVKKYLREKNLLARTAFFALSDIFGPAVKNKSFDAILVSAETFLNAVKINRVRKAKKMPPLKIIVAPSVKGDDGKIISSERIRNGEIDREGHSYEKIFRRGGKLVLPQFLRRELRRPLGAVFKGAKEQKEVIAKKIVREINAAKPTIIITVGDIVSLSLKNIGFEPDVKIIDFRERRKAINLSLKDIFLKNTRPVKVINEAGTIQRKAVTVLRSVMRSFFQKGDKQTMIIKGEEDLMTLPAVLFAPLCSLVVYGQYGLGAVVTEVTEEKKKEVAEILKSFIN